VFAKVRIRINCAATLRAKHWGYASRFVHLFSLSRPSNGHDDEASYESGRILSLTTQKATTFSRVLR
jgi:hypothetical protein